MLGAWLGGQHHENPSVRRVLEPVAENLACTTFRHGLRTVLAYRLIEGPCIVMRIPYGSLTGPADLLRPMGPLHVPYGPVRLIVLLSSTQSYTVLVCAPYRTGRVNLWVHALP